MKIEQLRAAMHAAPFQPFVIHVADGRSVRVPHPDFIALHALRSAIVTSSDKREVKYHVIDIPMITQLEVEGAPQEAHE